MQHFIWRCVWLNGQYLGQHEGGYTPFEFDITSVVKPGESNVLTVQVDNLRVDEPHSRRDPARLVIRLVELWWDHS